jgi:hypothetical protein
LNIGNGSAKALPRPFEAQQNKYFSDRVSLDHTRRGKLRPIESLVREQWQGKQLFSLEAEMYRFGSEADIVPHPSNVRLSRKSRR